MPSWKAWAQRPSELIKRGGAKVLLVQSTLIKVDNVLNEKISVIDLDQ
jgi:hypothetical protein